MEQLINSKNFHFIIRTSFIRGALNAALSLKPFEQEEIPYEKDKRAIKQLCAIEVTSLVCTHKPSEGEQS